MLLIFADKNKKTVLQDCLSSKVNFQMFLCSDIKNVSYLVKYVKHEKIVCFNEETSEILRSLEVDFTEMKDEWNYV